MLSIEQAVRGTEVIRGVVAASASPELALLFAKCFTSLIRAFNSESFLETAFEMLKYPNTVGETTQLLLESVEEASPKSISFKGDLWQAISYAEANWSLNLKALPKRPVAGSISE
jgi:hypothetical protein